MKTPHQRFYPEMIADLEDMALFILYDRPPLHAPIKSFRLSDDNLDPDAAAQAIVQDAKRLKDFYDTKQDALYSETGVRLSTSWLQTNPTVPEVHAVLLHELGHVFHLHGGRPYKGKTVMSAEEAKADLWAFGMAAMMGMESTVDVIRRKTRWALQTPPANQGDGWSRYKHAAQLMTRKINL